MEIQIIGDGSFGTYLKKELPLYSFNVVPKADSIILAVPYAAYETFADICIKENPEAHLINVCSIQSLSTDILNLKTSYVTSLHPLFGPRTPPQHRHTIVTNRCGSDTEKDFLNKFSRFSASISYMSPREHDELMAKTHGAALMAAKQAKHFVDAAKDIPDEFIPNSFRLLRNFVKTLEDMPSGTVESIMANPYL